MAYTCPDARNNRTRCFESTFSILQGFCRRLCRPRLVSSGYHRYNPDLKGS